MPATLTTDVAAWIPAVIGASLYDLAVESDYPLTALSTLIPDLAGKAGDRVTLSTLAARTAASNLAENVAAADENISGAGVTVTIKEAVKSLALSDRAAIQSSQNVSQYIGQLAGVTIQDRLELDLGAALLAGRLTTADTTLGTTFDAADIRLMRSKIPARLRKRGVVALGKADVLEQIFADASVNNAAAFGSDEAIRTGAISRPIYGVELLPVDDATFANITVATITGPPVVFMAKGMLLRAIQKDVAVETERDARARLTRAVATLLHGEGVVESAGVVAGVIG